MTPIAARTAPGLGGHVVPGDEYGAGAEEQQRGQDVDRDGLAVEHDLSWSYIRGPC
ncbi:hypothetical protein GT755_01705 [Herbidospora sp. NEAU-GS84]|uniref:Uncharacterized protein n=1 Tax=Herbidospora solisilvae TaxID=2696284 RepID=A0A7C9NYA7_9ACTN|nr:hypothetical protein [Herbidospora solisilvae]NAS20397.1 hypothetical protein [Herbidospora solisilvae]